MKSIDLIDPEHLSGVEVVLTDMDETLTHNGRLSADTFLALEELQKAGIAVIVNTAAPAGWCDQMARMWPIAGVIGENGGLFFRHDFGKEPYKEYWHQAPEPAMIRLRDIFDQVCERCEGIELAADQPFRQTSLAIKRRGESDRKVLSELRAFGADATINNLWVLAWLGGYDKLTMARRVLSKHYDIDVDANVERIVYLGDSENDAPMFAHFPKSFGMNTVGNGLSAYPTWQTNGPGGAGFVEVARRLLNSV